MKNPNWQREELILALDLYFNLDYGQMHGKNPKVIQLSKDLQKSGFHKGLQELENFRSPSSVALKLANFKKFDKNFGGRGMRDGGRLDSEIWKEFSCNKDRLKKEANLIREFILDNFSDNNRIESVEGHNDSYYVTFPFFEFHKNRETDPLIRIDKLNMIRSSGMEIRCHVCGFNPIEFYGEIGEDIMELHYVKDFKGKPDYSYPLLDDFIPVCPNCHKVLDKHYGAIDADNLAGILIKS